MVKRAKQRQFSNSTKKTIASVRARAWHLGLGTWDLEQMVWCVVIDPSICVDNCGPMWVRVGQIMQEECWRMWAD
jgi:hypothetical protein